MSQSYVGSGGGDQEAECPSPVRYFLQDGCPSLRFHQLPNSATNGELSVHIHSLVGGGVFLTQTTTPGMTVSTCNPSAGGGG